MVKHNIFLHNFIDGLLFSGLQERVREEYMCGMRKTHSQVSWQAMKSAGVFMMDTCVAHAQDAFTGFLAGYEQCRGFHDGYMCGTCTRRIHRFPGRL